MKGSHTAQAEWSRHFQNEGYQVRLAHDLGPATLSRQEVNLLNEISSERLGRDDFELAEETHGEDWQRNHDADTSTPIPLEHLIEAVGRSKDTDAILRDAEEKACFDRWIRSPIAQSMQNVNLVLHSLGRKAFRDLYGVGSQDEDEQCTVFLLEMTSIILYAIAR